MLSLQGLLVLICIFAFRIQMGAAFLAAFFFAFIAYLLDPVFHALGSTILELALIFLVFLGLLIGTFDFGQFLFIHQALVERARYAARWSTLILLARWV